MRKTLSHYIAIILALVLLLSVGGVYATWKFTERNVADVSQNASIEMNEFDYGLFMTTLTLLSFIPPFICAYICAKKSLKSVIIYGNILTFITSLIPTLVLNAISLTDKLGGSWYGTFKPLNSIQMVVACSVASGIIQCIIYFTCKIRND